MLAFLLVIFLSSTSAFLIRPSQFISYKSFSLQAQPKILSTGGLENIEFIKLDSSNEPDFGKYRVSGLITSRQLNILIRDYKEEMKRKRIILPGFRPGKVPPYAMPEIRSFVINYALEQVLQGICNANNLLVRIMLFSFIPSFAY